MLRPCFYTISDSILIAESEYAIQFFIACIFQRVLAFKVEKCRILGTFYANFGHFAHILLIFQHFLPIILPGTLLSVAISSLKYLIYWLNILGVINKNRFRTFRIFRQPRT